MTQPQIELKKYSLLEFLEFTKDKPEDERYELIDGRIYMMASPSMDHQDIAGFIYGELRNYLKGKPCKPFIAPFDVFLFEKSKEKDKIQNVFQPDVFVVCNKNKMKQRGIYGAPDFVVEVVSPSSETHDYLRKFKVYMKYGVREYWIVNPEKKEVTVYCNTEDEEDYKTYTFDDKIKVGIFDDFEIDFKELQI